MQQINVNKSNYEFHTSIYSFSLTILILSYEYLFHQSHVPVIQKIEMTELEFSNVSYLISQAHGVFILVYLT